MLSIAMAEQSSSKDCQSKTTTSSAPMLGFFPEAEVVMSTRAPKQVASYVLGARLGRGSYAKVKEGYHVDRPQSRLAVKIINIQRLRKKMLGDATTYMREISLLQTLNHPRIVRFVGSFEDLRRGKLYIALEYMAGGDLQHLIDSRTLSLPETRGVFRSLMEGLAYLHSQGIVHQDIKPSNLLINGIGAVKISDFGVAQYVSPENDKFEHDLSAPDEFSGSDSSSSSSSDDRHCSPCVLPPPSLLAAGNTERERCSKNMKQSCYAHGGAPAFQPPEMAVKEGPCTVNPATDVWSAGITLYRLVVGTFPFPVHDSNVYALLNTIAKGDFTIPENIEEQLQDLLRRLLDVDPLRRIEAAQVLEHPWLAKHSDDAPLTTLTFLPTLFHDSEGLDSNSDNSDEQLPTKQEESGITGDEDTEKRRPSGPSGGRTMEEGEDPITGEEDIDDDPPARPPTPSNPKARTKEKAGHCVDLCAVL